MIIIVMTVIFVMIQGFYLLDPMNEIHVSPDAILRSITRSKVIMMMVDING